MPAPNLEWQLQAACGCNLACLGNSCLEVPRVGGGEGLAKAIVELMVHLCDNKTRQDKIGKVSSAVGVRRSVLTAVNRKVETGGKAGGRKRGSSLILGRNVCGVQCKEHVEGSVPPAAVRKTPGRKASARRTCSVEGQLLAVNHPHDIELIIFLGHAVLQRHMQRPCRQEHVLVSGQVASHNSSAYPTLLFL